MSAFSTAFSNAFSVDYTQTGLVVNTRTMIAINDTRIGVSSKDTPFSTYISNGMSINLPTQNIVVSLNTTF